ncbi:uncharacterized protein LOC120460806 [Pimephales promelas]|uniref:uncharacterized protein LOC120460806 n=1 Tax=Pimephales promelas TaxID=90988 RepID=UPI001955749E|nr:uncharacterized protein LOC120460806 [Pimephales promelas]
MLCKLCSTEIVCLNRTETSQQNNSERTQICCLRFHFPLEVSSFITLISMVQIAKTLIFLCMLIGWSQAFPHRDVTSENEAMKDADRVDGEQRDAILNVTDFTPPVCHVVNDTSDCLLSCGNTSMEVTYIMTDGPGSGIDHTRVSSLGGASSIFTQYDGLDENGYNATLFHYSGICCLDEVEVSVLDKAGNIGKCPVIVKRVRL